MLMLKEEHTEQRQKQELRGKNSFKCTQMFFLQQQQEKERTRGRTKNKKIR